MKSAKKRKRFHLINFQAVWIGSFTHHKAIHFITVHWFRLFETFRRNSLSNNISVLWQKNALCTQEEVSLMMIKYLISNVYFFESINWCLSLAVLSIRLLVVHSKNSIVLSFFTFINAILHLLPLRCDLPWRSIFKYANILFSKASPYAILT